MTRGTIAIAIFLMPVVALAADVVPRDLQGDWTSAPPRCEQLNGEVDVLTLTGNQAGWYEIGCALSSPSRRGAVIRYDALCFKGGSPESKGALTLKRWPDGRVSVALYGFGWEAEGGGEYFHRCHSGRAKMGKGHRS